MKVLVISLLRAGDLLMQVPLFQALKKADPSVELHLLLNDEVKWIIPVLKEIDQFHLFPRQRWQRLLGEADHHLLRAPKEVGQFFLDLNKIDFSEVINLTHNRVSAFISQEIHCPVKHGLVSDGPKIQGLSNSWMRLFNARFSDRASFPFHYTEILGHSFNLDVVPATKVTAKPFKRIFIQALTSDLKKNWSLASFRQLVDRIYDQQWSVPVKILCSQKEKQSLKNIFYEEELCDDSLEKLQQSLGPEDIVISGDTAVMHLAAALGCQVVELALGSSDPWRTAPYREEAYVVSSRVECYPCSHRQGCSQISHFCGDSVTVSAVMALLKFLLGKQGQEKLSLKVNPSLLIQRVQIHPQLGLYLEDLRESNNVRLLNKALWLAIGSTSWRWEDVVSSSPIANMMDLISTTQQELKKRLSEIQADFEVLIQQLSLQQLSPADIQLSRIKLGKLYSEHEAVQEWLRSFQDLAQQSFPSPLHYLSAYQDHLESFKSVLFERDKLIETIQSGGKDEPGRRKVPTEHSADA